MKITVYNDWDHVPKAESEGTDEAILAWDGEYRKGDIIEFSDLKPGRFYIDSVFPGSIPDNGQAADESRPFS